MSATKCSYHLHQSYCTRLEQMEPGDADDFHALSVAVNWPHRPQDMDLLLGLGYGLIARDQIGRPLGAGMCFEYEANRAMIGMMMTHPKLQAGGLGREILSRLETRLEGRPLRLNGTKSAWRLYRSVGFRETGSVVQYQGICTAPRGAAPVPGLRRATAADLAGIGALDNLVFGAARPAILARLFEVSEVHVLETEGKVTGFAMCRRFGRGRVIGPLVSASQTEAMALIQACAAPYPDSFFRLDADAIHAALGRYLNAIGLDSYDTVVPMTRGAHYGPENAEGHIYALASQALG